MPAIGDWGIYNWFIEHGANLIHPDDMKSFQSLMPSGKMFECIGEESGYLRLKYADRVYRVKPDLFKAVAAPAKRFGDKIRIVTKGMPRDGIIVGITWHLIRSEPYYIVSVDGKPLKRWYWGSEFVSST